MEEIWKPIEELNGLYLVSNFGRIKSVERVYYSGTNHRSAKVVPGKIRKPKISNKGYAWIGVTIDGQYYQRFVHRLVADAFVPGKSEKNNIINHKDRNPLNNHADNLEWCDQRYNLNYPGRLEAYLKTMNEGNKWRFPPRRVRCILDGKELAEFGSIADAARFYNIDDAAIARVCIGKTKSCQGLKWRYVNNEEPVMELTEDEWTALKQSEEARVQTLADRKGTPALWKIGLPDGFMELYELWRAGKVSKKAGAKMLKISRRAFSDRIKYFESLATTKIPLASQNPPKAVEAWKDGKLVKRYSSIRAAAREIGAFATNICYCCKGKKRSCAGFEWRYAQEDAPLVAAVME